MLDKIKKIKELKQKEHQFLIRTDIETNGWFIHFSLKEYFDDNGWKLQKSYIKDYFSDSEVDNILDLILEYLETGSFIKVLD